MAGMFSNCVLRRNVSTSVWKLTKDSGFGGSIRQAGGAFAEREKAKEDQYFYNIQKDQLKRMKEDSKKKIKYHKDQIDKHEQAIKKEEDKFKDRQG